jgi:ATP-binding protein involved in chromosome partitioning
VLDVTVHHGVLDDDRRVVLVDQLHQGRITFNDAGSKTRVLLISSGKGGVGKSSVTVNVAVALARLGRHVAVVDADVWGFSIPAMLGLDRPPTLVDNRMILPPVAHGVACASIGFFVGEDQPVVWRGPMLHKALEQFLTDFYWGEPDYVLVDMPPGTGDIAISLAGFLPTAEAYVVTTPQPAAQRVAQRAGLMFQSSHVKIPVRGVVENMSWFTGDDGKRYELFGAGGGQQLAERLDVPLIGQVPLVSALREGGDVGRPVVVEDPESEAARAFGAIAEWIDEHKPTRRRSAALKIG